MANRIIGRDGYTMAEAIAYAIAFIGSLPAEKQELSDRDDVVALLNRTVPDAIERECLKAGAEARTGVSDLTDW